jgi:hypothetical protein
MDCEGGGGVKKGRQKLFGIEGRYIGPPVPSFVKLTPEIFEWRVHKWYPAEDVRDATMAALRRKFRNMEYRACRRTKGR